MFNSNNKKKAMLILFIFFPFLAPRPAKYKSKKNERRTYYSPIPEKCTIQHTQLI